MKTAFSIALGLFIGFTFNLIDKAQTEAENARATLADAYCVTPTK